MAISGGIAEKPVGQAGETFATYTESVEYSALRDGHAGR